MIIRGIDTLEFGLNVENYDNSFRDKLIEFDDLKKSSQEDFKNTIININGINLVVKPKGQGMYAYKLECDDFHICFMKNEILNTPPISVRFISQFIWRYGVREAYTKFLEWFDGFNLHIVENKITRGDICLDIDEANFVEEDRLNFVTKVKNIEKYMATDNINYNLQDFTGVFVGKGSPLSLRIYNKSLEIKKSNKKWFHDIWANNGWNGSNKVWRIEYQLRRGVLKELGIYTVEDFLSNIDSLWKYLTQKWFSIRKRTDKNISRCEIDERWILVQKANLNYCATMATRNKIKKGDVNKIIIQIQGLLLSLSALINLDNLKDTWLFTKQKIKQLLKDNNLSYKEEVEKRKNRFFH